MRSHLRLIIPTNLFSGCAYSRFPCLLVSLFVFPVLSPSHWLAVSLPRLKSSKVAVPQAQPPPPPSSSSYSIHCVPCGTCHWLTHLGGMWLHSRKLGGVRRQREGSGALVSLEAAWDHRCSATSKVFVRGTWWCSDELLGGRRAVVLWWIRRWRKGGGPPASSEACEASMRAVVLSG